MNQNRTFLARALRVASAVLALFLGVGSVRLEAQNVKTSLQRLIETGARAYIQPLAAGFATNINGGWLHEAPPARTGAFMLELGAVAMLSGAPANQTFSVASEYALTPEQASAILARASGYSSLPQAAREDILRAVVARSLPVEISGPTVIGNKNDNVRIGIIANQMQRTFTTTIGGQTATVVLPENEAIRLDVRGLLDTRDYFLNSVPFATPQLTIGTLMGTRAVLRFVPNIADWVGLGTLGNIGMFGWGVQHNPLVWFAADTNALPFSIGLNYFSQQYALTDAVSARGSAYGVSASWTFGGAVFAFTPYAGFLLETTEMNVRYEYQPRTANGAIALDIDGRPIAPVPINFDIVGDNTSRFVFGLSARILYLADVGVEINVGNRYSTINANASIRIGNDLPK
jgi:hypothetical protein